MGLVPCYFAFFSLSTQAGRIQTTIMRTIFEGRGQSGAVAAVEAARMTARKKKRKRRHGAVAAVAGGVQLFDFISRLLLEADAARGGNIVERRKKGCLSLSRSRARRAVSARETRGRVQERPPKRNVLFRRPNVFFFFVFFALHSDSLFRSAERDNSPSLSLSLSLCARDGLARGSGSHSIFKLVFIAVVAQRQPKQQQQQQQ